MHACCMLAVHPYMLHAGGKVLDLGCSPGAWMQVACQELGPKERGGVILGVDIQVGNMTMTESVFALCEVCSKECGLLASCLGSNSRV